MSLTETEKNQLAGPRRLEELPPPPFGFADLEGNAQDEPAQALPVVDIVPDSLEIPEPSFLVSAKLLASSFNESAMARSRLAQAEIAAGNKDEAARHAIEALELPDADTDASATFAAVRTLAATGAYTQAEEMLDKLAKPGPLALLHATLAARRGDLDAAFERLGDDESPDAWELRGWISLQQSHFDQAIRFYRKAMRATDPGPTLLANLGLAHASLGAPEKAITETRQALARGPLQHRRVALNLIAYLFSIGASDEGFRELRKLQEEYPKDIELVFAEAHWALAVGESDRAGRRLRYARSSLWDFATELQKAELLANRAYLDYYTSKISTKEAADQVIAQMQKTEWKSTRLVSMIPILLNQYSDADRLAKVREEVSNAHPTQKFRVLDLHLAVLRDDIDEALRQALKWTKEALFSPEASSWAIFLLTQVEDRFEEASRIGRCALRRMPAAVVVANNTAYSLALAGRADEAKVLLRREEDGEMLHLATQGLIQAVRGNIDEANRLYDRAEEEATSRNGVASASVLVNLHRRLIGVVAPETDPSRIAKPVELPADWDDHPPYVLCLRMLKRQNAPLQGITVGEDGNLLDL
jgi:Flp pilus assembly protein TadD